MKWDAGALSPHRNMSPIFRFISSNPPRYYTWPKKWQEEFVIFCYTPGVTWGWIEQNFNYRTKRIQTIRQAYPELEKLGMENALSATYEDALMYVQNKPHMGHIPFWAEPFILDDLKNNVGWTKVRDKWQISEDTMNVLRRGRRNNGIFYPSLY